jgi:hypothetical protein
LGIRISGKTVSVTEMLMSEERQARIAEIKHTLFVNHGVEDGEIPFYLRGLRLLNAGRPLVGVHLPKGKISFEDFDGQVQNYKEKMDEVLELALQEDDKIDAYEAELTDPLLPEHKKRKYISGKAASEQVLNQHYVTLSAYDMKSYELYNLHPIDAKKFYTDITPLMHELMALLADQAHARRHGRA